MDYRGYRIVPAISCQVAIMSNGEAIDFVDDDAEARAVIDGWLNAR